MGEAAVSDSAPGSSTVLWQARVPRDLARALEADMEVLGLKGQSELIREALRLLHRHAGEMAMAADYERFYGEEPAPPATVTAALYAEQE